MLYRRQKTSEKRILFLPPPSKALQLWAVRTHIRKTQKVAEERGENRQFEKRQKDRKLRNFFAEVTSMTTPCDIS